MPSVTATPDVRLQVEELRELFGFKQLPPHLQDVSRPFAELAERVCGTRVWGNQTIDALQHLLRAKDAAVRAVVWSLQYDAKG